MDEMDRAGSFEESKELKKAKMLIIMNSNLDNKTELIKRMGLDK